MHADNAIRLWDIQNDIMQPISTLLGHSDFISSVCIELDVDYLTTNIHRRHDSRKSENLIITSSSYDGSIRTWDLLQEKECKVYIFYNLFFIVLNILKYFLYAGIPLG